MTLRDWTLVYRHAPMGQGEVAMWYCLRRTRPSSSGLTVGRWYEEARPPGMEGRIPTVYLTVDGDEVTVPQGHLIIRETMADYSYAYNERIMQTQEGEPVSFEMSWVPVCPEGHRGPKQASRPTHHECSECGTNYAVPLKDSGPSA